MTPRVATLNPWPLGLSFSRESWSPSGWRRSLRSWSPNLVPIHLVKKFSLYPISTFPDNLRLFPLVLCLGRRHQFPPQESFGPSNFFPAFSWHPWSLPELSPLHAKLIKSPFFVHPALSLWSVPRSGGAFPTVTRFWEKFSAQRELISWLYALGKCFLEGSLL